LIASRWKLCSEGEILFVFSENVSLALCAQALDFGKSLLYPPKSRAKPDALFVDPLILNAVFQFETLFVFLIWIVPATSQWCFFDVHLCPPTLKWVPLPMVRTLVSKV